MVSLYLELSIFRANLKYEVITVVHVILGSASAIGRG